MRVRMIYYADDDIDDLDLFKKAIDRAGVKTSLGLYSNGDDFLNEIKKNKQAGEALVFLDINMPGKSGLAILKEMRESEQLKNTPVVMYSTSNDPNAIMASQVTGANLYVVKPTSFLDLKQILQKVMEIDWNKYICPPENFVLQS